MIQDHLLTYVLSVVLFFMFKKIAVKTDKFKLISANLINLTKKNVIFVIQDID